MVIILRSQRDLGVTQKSITQSSDRIGSRLIANHNRHQILSLVKAIKLGDIFHLISESAPKKDQFSAFAQKGPQKRGRRQHEKSFLRFQPGVHLD